MRSSEVHYCKDARVDEILLLGKDGSRKFLGTYAALKEQGLCEDLGIHEASMSRQASAESVELAGMPFLVMALYSVLNHFVMIHNTQIMARKAIQTSLCNPCHKGLDPPVLSHAGGHQVRAHRRLRMQMVQKNIMMCPSTSVCCV